MSALDFGAAPSSPASQFATSHPNKPSHPLPSSPTTTPPRKRPRFAASTQNCGDGTESESNVGVVHSVSPLSRVSPSRREHSRHVRQHDGVRDALLFNLTYAAQRDTAATRTPPTMPTLLASPTLTHQLPLSSASDRLASPLPPSSSGADEIKREPLSTAPIIKPPSFNLESVTYDFDIPSPPSTSEDEPRTPGEAQQNNVQPCTIENMEHERQSSPSRIPQPTARCILNEDSRAPSCSQDSAFFSFSHQPSSQTAPPKQPPTPSVESAAASYPPTAPERQPRYYTKSFCFVIDHVLQRYTHILRNSDVNLARQMQTTLTDNALSFFVRIYRRRQPHWYRVEALSVDYKKELDVEQAVRELCNARLLSSSAVALKGTPAVTPLLAAQLLPSLFAPELRAICVSVVDGAALRRLPKARLLKELTTYLSENPPPASAGSNAKASRYRQTTLSGMRPAQCLARAILKRAGDCVSIPGDVLISLERINFLFFLEDGPDSPNVILADTGKAKFADYVCDPSALIFSSAEAYELYEEAVDLERELNTELEARNFEGAAHFGSIAEMEVREFLKGGDSHGGRSTGGAEFSQRNEGLSSAAGHIQSPDGDARRELVQMEVKRQLAHPFLKRFTAQWVYVRACWHSVHALERLQEHEGAIARLQLLLRTGMMARRRGKCLNRLTINLHRHVGRTDEALDVILQTLRQASPRLNFGDRMALAQRGVAIHRGRATAVVEKRVREAGLSRIKRKRAVVEEVAASVPVEILEVLRENEMKVAVRKIFGKSLNVQSRERHKRVSRIEDGWQRFLAENSRDSVDSVGDDGERRPRSVMGRAVFRSLDGLREVSVEEYCLEWYLAKGGWQGRHDEGGAVRFLFGLLMCENVIFRTVGDVFQTPYQDRPLDLMTEAFHESRHEAIEDRVTEIAAMDRAQLREETMRLYEKFEGTRVIGCLWVAYMCEELGCIAAGLGPAAVARCCQLLCEDYTYWAGGLPDLVLWRVVKEDENVQQGDGGGVEGERETHERFESKLVEVKSARDNLSDRQRAWLVQLGAVGTDCEVCKVVEKVTTQNVAQLEDAQLEHVELHAVAPATKGERKEEQGAVSRSET